MKYKNMQRAVFLSRPNRFIAIINLDGKELVCHVKNTGRCKELLVPGAEIMVQMAENPNRKTSCDLISVWKGERLINMDSQIPNKVFAQWAADSGFFPKLSLLRPEKVYGNSRFDFYAEYGEKEQAYIEVKGVTLEEDGIVLFPDAPTQRGLKHLRELAACREEGYNALVVFIVQMNGVRYFTPNKRTDPEFATALSAAKAAGVQLLALSCNVTEDSIESIGEVPILL